MALSVPFQRPSLQGRFSLIWSGDSALQPRPEDPAQGDEWDATLETCRERGVWAPLLKEGDERPTVFTFEFPRGTPKRRLLDLIGNLAAGQTQELAALFVRATLREVTNLGDYRVKISRDRDRGIDLVDDELIDILDQYSPAIVLELASVGVGRFTRPPGK